MSVRVMRTAHRGAHLVHRFGGTLRARAISPAERGVGRVRAHPGRVRGCGTNRARADQVEAIAVARRLPDAIAIDDRWVAAALLHDVGKQAAGLGTAGRVLATVLAAAGRVPVEVPGAGTDRPGLRARMARYVDHPRIGADRLAQAGARPEAVSWTAAHHDPTRWPGTSIPPEVCLALARADGETNLGS